MLASTISRYKNWLYLLLILTIVLLAGIPTVQAEIEAKALEEIRTILPNEWGVPHPEGLTYSAQRNLFFLLEKNPSEQATGQSTVVILTPHENLVNAARFNFNIGDAINIAFDDNEDRLFLLGGAPLQLVQIKMGANGTLDPASETRYDASRFGLSNPEGMTVDHRGKFLFILDRQNSQVVRLEIRDSPATARFEKFDLAAKGLTGLRGLAVNLENHHLFALSPSKKMLYELTEDFKYLAQYDLSALKLVDPLALVFAYSPDQTDDSKIVHLFVTDSNLPTTQSADEPEGGEAFSFRTYLPAIFQADDGVNTAESSETTATLPAIFGRIVELNLDLSNSGPGLVNAASVDVITLQLVQTINTSAFSPPSPDPSGITYVPANNRVLESDAEVEEMGIYAGRNLFGVTPPGATRFTGVSTEFTNEPAGIAHDPGTGRFFYADDDQKRIWVVNVGNDGVLGNPDDTASFFSTTGFGAMDPEGIDFDTSTGNLWMVDGGNREVYHLNPNTSTRLAQFDTQSLGINDPEGIAVHPNGNLILTGSSRTTIYEVTKVGVLVETYNIAAANAVKIGGVMMAPGSNNPALTNFWLVDRGIDNDVNPNENDGKVYELTTGGPPPPTATPTSTPIPGTRPLIYFGSQSDGTVGGVAYADEDMLTYNSTNSSFALFLDGSDLGFAASDVKGFERLSDGSILLTFIANVTLSQIGVVENRDIVRFIPTSTGTDTVGTFEWYFDGSDVGLGTTSQGIDGLHRLNDGRLLISVLADTTITGIGTLADEDLAVFTFSGVPGQNTSGTWALYFDGSDVGLADGADGEDIYGVWVHPTTAEIYLTTRGNFSVPGVTGGAEDIFICTPGNLGATTSCTYRSFWDGSAFGFTQQMDSLGVSFSVLQAAELGGDQLPQVALPEGTPTGEAMPSNEAGQDEESEE